MVQVRPFARRDREQLVRLVNAHVATAMPGASIPPALLLNQLEHPVGEPIIGPWEIAWLVCWPHHLDAGRAVLDAARAHLEGWEIRVCYADGTLPIPGVGDPDA